MNIAVVDVAADSGGALSILRGFYEYIKSLPQSDIRWFLFLSQEGFEDTSSITVVRDPMVKKSWGHRMWWEYHQFKEYVKEYKIDSIFSLQNKALPIGGVKQVVYFHNALHFLPLFSKRVFEYGLRRVVYRTLVTPTTFESFKYCEKIIVQSETVKSDLEKKTNREIIVVRPSIEVEGESGDNKVNGFIYPGIASVYKNQMMIVEADCMCGDDSKNELLFTINGNENKYAKKVSRSVQSNHVKLIGYQKREDLLEMYKQYGLICSSDVETLFVPFVEAMKYGTPILARDLPYAREVLEGYSNAFFYSTPDELAELLKESYSRMIVQDSLEGDNSWGKVIEEIKV